MKEKISLDEAQELVLSAAAPLDTERIDLLEAAGRVLAREVLARDFLPSFRRSTMDGYALRSADTRNKETAALKVLAELPAGQLPSVPLEPGTCMMVMTGAPVPEEADAVVRREDVARNGALAVVPGGIEAGTNIQEAGCDISAGMQLLVPGMVVGPGEAAVLAAQGYAEVEVYRRPRVAVLSTGDELLDVREPLLPGKVRNSNRYMLAAAVQEAGGRVLLYPSLPDELEASKEMLTRAGEEADLVLSTGGVSMGDFDLVRQALLETADEVFFWKVRIKPGMPVVAAVRGKTVYLGLAGKPNGALVNFYLLAGPVIARLGGRTNIFPPVVEAALENGFARSSPERSRYLWAVAGYQNGWRAALNEGGELAAMRGYNALAEIPAGSGPLAPGDMVRTILLDRHSCRVAAPA